MDKLTPEMQKVLIEHFLAQEVQQVACAEPVNGLAIFITFFVFMFIGIILGFFIFGERE